MKISDNQVCLVLKQLFLVKTVVRIVFVSVHVVGI